MRGQVGEYVDETADQLRIQVGEGITGWVAAHRVAQNLPDAAADPRANTIPGTDDDLDESMLLAPMLFEDDVLGVLVLSKLGLDQFTEDDLRLLVIYASFAAQAMAHADATERLRRQVQGQRHLLQITESILTTLDTRCRPRLGRGSPGGAGRLGQRLGRAPRQRDGRPRPGHGQGRRRQGVPGALAPGRDRPRALGRRAQRGRPDPRPVRRPARVSRWRPGPFTVASSACRCTAGPARSERSDPGAHRRGPVVHRARNSSSPKLFAAQVSIAVQNAEAHGAIARQAETDDLTGLGNHRSFRHALSLAVSAGEPFSLMMVDLDRFKLVNDNFGHQVGNEVLQLAAQSIVRASRDSDAAFRYGGDEFTVLLPHTDAEHVVPVADRIRRALADAPASVAGMARGRGHGRRLGRRRRPTRPTAPRPTPSSWRPTGPASSPSARAAAGSPPPARAWRSRAASPSRSRRRSTPGRNRAAANGVRLAAWTAIREPDPAGTSDPGATHWRRPCSPSLSRSSRSGSWRPSC